MRSRYQESKMFSGPCHHCKVRAFHSFQVLNTCQNGTHVSWSYAWTDLLVVLLVLSIWPEKHLWETRLQFEIYYVHILCAHHLPRAIVFSCTRSPVRLFFWKGATFTACSLSYSYCGTSLIGLYLCKGAVYTTCAIQLLRQKFDWVVFVQRYQPYSMYHPVVAAHIWLGCVCAKVPSTHVPSSYITAQVWLGCVCAKVPSSQHVPSSYCAAQI